MTVRKKICLFIKFYNRLNDAQSNFNSTCSNSRSGYNLPLVEFLNLMNLIYLLSNNDKL